PNSGFLPMLAPASAGTFPACHTRSNLAGCGGRARCSDDDGAGTMRRSPQMGGMLAIKAHPVAVATAGVLNELHGAYLGCGRRRQWTQHLRLGVSLMTRILISDAHDVVRFGVRHILETQPSWEIVGEASNGPEAVTKADELKPDVAVMGYSLPLLNGVE